VVLVFAGLLLTVLGWISFAVAFRRASFLSERGRRTAVTLLVGGVIAMVVPGLWILFHLAVLAVTTVVGPLAASRVFRWQ
jgi:hypothetical protein